MPRKLILSAVCLLFMFVAKSQTPAPFNGTVLNYGLNAAPIHGVKIKTNLPFFQSSQMPTIIIEGYDFHLARTINVTLTYYILSNQFHSASASSAGGAAPPIRLASENGKVVIFLNIRDFFTRFTVRAYASGLLPQEIPANFSGWTAADEAVTGTIVTDVKYVNNFSGSVGIGTHEPAAPLHIVNSTQHPTDTSAQVAAILGGSWSQWTYFGGLNGGRMRGSADGYLVVESAISGTNNALYLNSHSAGNIFMARGGGNVGIGVNNTGDYKLAVNGTIGAKKVKVTQSGWADFVFEPDYDLMSLAEMEAFIKTNKHLPEIPSAKEVETDGLDLGEINKKLLQKIEELTLHLIEENKKNDQQTLQLQSQSQMLLDMKQELDAIKKKLK